MRRRGVTGTVSAWWDMLAALNYVFSIKGSGNIITYTATHYMMNINGQPKLATKDEALQTATSVMREMIEGMFSSAALTYSISGNTLTLTSTGSTPQTYTKK